MHELMSMVGNQVLSVIDPDFIGNAAEWLVLSHKHRCTDSSFNHKAVRRIMSDGIGQTIAVVKRFLASICQQPYGNRNLYPDRTNLPEARGSFSNRGCMLTCQFIDEANTRVAV